MVAPQPKPNIKARAAQKEFPKATLARRVDITHDLMIIWLKCEEEFTFKPGQYCTLGLDGIERAYSIVSGPHESELEIFVELVPLPDGVLTPKMWEMKVGDSMTIRPRAKGIFTLDQRYKQHLMVATVTGIAPFLSMIRSYLYNGDQGHRFYVLCGASYQEEFVTYKEEMESLARAHPDVIAFIPTVSRPQEKRNQGWIGDAGRVNLIVEKYIEQWELEPKATLIYACGHPGMIEDVKERSIAKEFKVKEERFWKE